MKSDEKRVDSGIDPLPEKPVRVAKKVSDRKFRPTLMRFFKPENDFEVREALTQAKRTDLIGDGGDCLIPAIPPKEALEARRKRVNASGRGTTTLLWATS